jgi:hypothetical protein
MADRGRDLKLSFVSDVDKVKTEPAARSIDELAEAAEKAGKKLEELNDADTRGLDDLERAARTSSRELRDLDDNLERPSRGLGELGRDARDTARKVDDAFDSIAKSSRRNLRDKVDDDLDAAGRGLDEFKSEAASSGREAAASFGGGFDDITGFIQETAANAFSGFGALGAVAGTAAALGIGVITKVFDDSKERAEKAKEEIAGWVDAFVEGQGRIKESAIVGKLNELFGDPERYKEIARQADEAGISVVQYARALSGDAEAAADVARKVRGMSAELDAAQSRTTESEAATLRQSNALKEVSSELGISTGALSDAEKAWRDLDAATRAGITAGVEVDAPTDAQLRAEHRAMRSILGQPVTVPVGTQGGYAAAVAERNRIQSYFFRNPVQIPVNPKPGSGQGYGVVRNYP